MHFTQTANEHALQKYSIGFPGCLKHEKTLESLMEVGFVSKLNSL
jgi:hypothetical protein